MKGAARRRERGFALLIVLWTLVMVALLGTTITAAGRDEVRIAGNILTQAGTEAAADGAVAAAMFHLAARNNQRWAPDATAHALVIGTDRVTVRVADQDGMIDPNQAPPSLLAALLRVQGVDDATASNVASAIVDWRSPADAGLAQVYRAQGRNFGPPHEAFQSVDELELVAYVTPSIMKLLRPHIDPFIQSTPDPNLADPIVTDAIQDATRRGSLALDPNTLDGPAVLLVTATAQGRGAAFTRRALVRYDPSNAPPFTVLEWTAG